MFFYSRTVLSDALSDDEKEVSHLGTPRRKQGGHFPTDSHRSYRYYTFDSHTFAAIESLLHQYDWGQVRLVRWMTVLSVHNGDGGR